MSKRGESPLSVSSLTIYYQNVRGLRTKLSDVFNSILSSDYPIIAFSETWLCDSIYSSEVIDDRYNVYRRDRKNNNSSKTVRGGGVLIAVLKSLFSCELCTIRDREEIWIKIRLNQLNLILCSVYFPPASPATVYQGHMRQAEHVINNNENATVCLLGDYNLPGVKWNKASHDK